MALWGRKDIASARIFNSHFKQTKSQKNKVVSFHYAAFVSAITSISLYPTFLSNYPHLEDLLGEHLEAGMVRNK